MTNNPDWREEFYRKWPDRSIPTRELYGPNICCEGMHKVKKTKYGYKTLLLFGVGATVIAAAGYFYYKKGKDGNEGKDGKRWTKVEGKTDITKNEPRNEIRDDQITVDINDEQSSTTHPENLTERITRWMNLLHQDPDSKFVHDEGRDIEKILMGLDLGHLKLDLAQVKSFAEFLTMYANPPHSPEGDQNGKSLATMKLNNRAWDILSLGGGSAEVEMMRLDVATRLQDRRLMMEVFDRVIERYNSEPKDDQELHLFTFMFITAPHLGRWKHTRFYGNFQQERLKNFHNASKKSFFPDYEVLWNLAEEEYNQHGDAPIDQVKWQEFKIQSHQIKFNRVECDDSEEKKRYQEMMGKKDEWRSHPLDDEDKTKIYRLGAVAQMLSPTQSKCLLVGPTTDDRMKIQGYEIIDGIHQTEMYELIAVTRNAELIEWEGKFVLTHIPENIDERGRQIQKDLIFDAKIRVTLVKDTGRYNGVGS